MRGSVRFLILAAGFCWSFSLIAQEDTLSRQNSGDFRVITADSIPSFQKRLPLSDSLVSIDTSNLGLDSIPVLYDSIALLQKPPKGDITTTINYNARDSIFFDMNKQNLRMFGETHIDYGSITLDAAITEVSLESRTINATYVRDSTNRKVGKPVFSEGTDIYETDHIIYNFNTKRAQIKGVVTEQQGAYMHGEDVKKNEKDEMFIRNAGYTTCNLADPHFHIVSQKLKVTKSNVISGPFNLRFREVITPLWFPFGMFPQPKQRTSGIVFPTYGEESARGFFLRDGGYYWSISDYVDLRLTGDFYSKGGYAINTQSNYRVRYKFSGTSSFTYNRNISTTSDNIPVDATDFWVRWSHRPESRGNSSLSASVSAGTSTYSQNNNLVSRNYDQSISSRFTSNINYTQRFPGSPFNLSMSGRHSQDVSTGAMTITLPEMSLNMSRIYPLKDVVSSKNEMLSKLGFSYNFVAKNELTNTAGGSFPFTVHDQQPVSTEPLPFTSENFSQILNNSRTGGRHQIPISTSIGLIKNVSLNPSFNYEEVWYPRELKYTYLPEDSTVQVDTINGFSRASSWRSGASINTIIYGTKFFRTGSYVQAIRHVMTPSVSFSYNPNFGDPDQGVWSWVKKSPTDSILISKYHGNGFAYGSPAGRESKSMGFSLQNNLELKVRDKKDTTGIGFKKVKLFDNLGFTSGYDFAKDSFQLSDISWNTRTSFFENKLSIALSGVIDPYSYELISESTNPAGDRVVVQRQVNRYAWHNGGGIGRLERLSTNISLNLRPKTRDGRQSETPQSQDPYSTNLTDPLGNRMDGGLGDLSLQDEAELEYIRQNPNEYVDFSIPWDMGIQYNVSFTQMGYQDPVFTQTMSLRGSLSLTPKTKIQARTSFDFKTNSFVATSLSINRDLHCWSLAFNWVPFGNNQSFSVVLRPKSAILQDLKLQRRGGTNYY